MCKSPSQNIAENPCRSGNICRVSRLQQNSSPTLRFLLITPQILRYCGGSNTKHSNSEHIQNSNVLDVQILDDREHSYIFSSYSYSPDN